MEPIRGQRVVSSWTATCPDLQRRPLASPIRAGVLSMIVGFLLDSCSCKSKRNRDVGMNNLNHSRAALRLADNKKKLSEIEARRPVKANMVDNAQVDRRLLGFFYNCAYAKFRQQQLPPIPKFLKKSIRVADGFDHQAVLLSWLEQNSDYLSVENKVMTKLSVTLTTALFD